ncbi:MAG: LysE family translocator, partial [Chloroflexota bacterium]
VILATSAEAFTLVKLAGAAYLAYLGVQSLRSSFRNEAPTSAPPRRAGDPFLQGLLSNVLNPKVAVFYLTFMPQFMSPGDNVLMRSLAFAAAHGIMGVVWLSAYAYVVSRVSAMLGGAGVRRWLERATGGVLLALGARLALERR